MDQHEHHEDLINKVSDELALILKKSQQAIYIYLDDKHKACNEHFANLLEYNSPKEWSGVHESFTEAFVDTDSQDDLVDAYRNAIEKLVGSSIEVNWKTKSGKIVKTNVILVPFEHNSHIFALHFISKL